MSLTCPAILSTTLGQLIVFQLPGAGPRTRAPVYFCVAREGPTKKDKWRNSPIPPRRAYADKCKRRPRVCTTTHHHVTTSGLDDITVIGSETFNAQ